MPSYESQHKKGKLHAEERLRLLFDGGIYKELITEKARDGVYICEGVVCGVPVVVAAQDFMFKGGSLGARHGANIAFALDLAIKRKCPFICINDSGGARIQEGVDALAAYGNIFFRHTKASGVVPQISIIDGPCAGGAAYSPGLTDFVFVVENLSYMFITGPSVVKSVTKEQVSTENLGGAAVHASESGVAHFKNQNEKECFEQVRKLISLLPQNNSQKLGRQKKRSWMPPKIETVQIPKDRKKGYDVRNIIAGVFDEDSFLEIQSDFARSVVVGFAGLEGQTIGIVASQPLFMAGVLDCNSSDKAARFVRFCDAFNIPIVTFTDVTGFLPGTVQERMGIIRHGAKLLFAFSEATVPKINVILRKAYGGAYIAMNSKTLGADRVYAWPNAEVAVMGESGAVEILYAKEARPLPEGEKDAFLQKKAIEYRQQMMNCDRALKMGFVDEMIFPEQTREKLVHTMKGLLKKRRPFSSGKRHGCIPL